MTLYMPPLSRKKRADTRYDPDTRRVFNTEDTEYTSVTGQTHYQNALQGRQRKQQIVRPSSGTRKHNPHPRDVGFLRQDVALLNDPICHVQTRQTDHEQPEWWPSRTSKEPLKQPPYTYDSTMRCDFKNKVDENNPGLTRHGCNPNIHAANGIVPVNRLFSKRGPRLIVEHISYEHQYDSRGNTNNPVRGKRHGSFVWDILHPVDPPPNYVPSAASSSTRRMSMMQDNSSFSAPPEKQTSQQVTSNGTQPSEMPPVA